MGGLQEGAATGRPGQENYEETCHVKTLLLCAVLKVIGKLCMPLAMWKIPAFSGFKWRLLPNGIFKPQVFYIRSTSTTDMCDFHT